MIKRYIENFKKSKTVRMALLKKIGGTLTIIIANLGYFEHAVTPVVFGIVTILFGVADYHIRTLTTKPLGEK